MPCSTNTKQTYPTLLLQQIARNTCAIAGGSIPGGGVTSIAGAANQIAASSPTGAVTLSLVGPHAFTTLTATAVLLGNGTSPIAASNMTYVTPVLTVPASFAITGAGSLAFNAGGANQAVSVTPSGTGAINLNGTTGGVRLPSTNTAGLQLYNTVDQTTNTERLQALVSSNVFQLGAATAGTGTGRMVSFYSQGSSGGAGFARIDLNPQAVPFVRFGYFNSATGTTNVSLAVNGTAFSLANITNTVTSGSFIAASITPTYNQASGTAANTDLLINRTETAVGSGIQRLIDAQVGGSSQFSISNTGIINAFASTATPAGGSTSARIVFGTTAGFGIYVGSGAPTVSAAQGSLYLRSDGSGVANRLYVNTTGSNVWTNFTSAS